MHVVFQLYLKYGIGSTGLYCTRLPTYHIHLNQSHHIWKNLLFIPPLVGFSNDKWVFVFPDTTKEVSSPLLILIFVFKSFCFTLCYVLYIFVTQRQTYSTLGEVLNRLDFSSAIQDLRRFNYVAKVRDNNRAFWFTTVLKGVFMTCPNDPFISLYSFFSW